MKVKGKIGGIVPVIETKENGGKASIHVQVGDLTVVIQSGPTVSKSGLNFGTARVITQRNGVSVDGLQYAVSSPETQNALLGAMIRRDAEKAKTNPAASRPARSSRKKDNPEYTHYVVTADGRINSGWHYASDARDVLKEDKHGGPSGPGARVLARVTLVRMGKDPKVNANWQFGNAAPVRSNPKRPVGTVGNPRARLTKEQKKALEEYNFALSQEDRYLGSVFVTPAGQKRVEATTAAAYARCKALGMTHEHGL